MRCILLTNRALQRVLIVDDIPDILGSLREMLDLEDNHLVETATGAEGANMSSFHISR